MMFSSILLLQQYRLDNCIIMHWFSFFSLTTVIYNTAIVTELIQRMATYLRRICLESVLPRCQPGWGWLSPTSGAIYRVRSGYFGKCTLNGSC